MDGTIEGAMRYSKNDKYIDLASDGTIISFKFANTNEDGSNHADEFDTTVNSEKQGRHIENSKNYIEGKSIFDGSVEDAQKLVNDYAGTGEWIGTNKERVDFGKVIGKYINQATGEKSDTTRGIIHYSKTGTHIVPSRPVK